jgi:catechol 2,3-dioxygenase-like lactoylglutathione lyase family enzyme
MNLRVVVLSGLALSCAVSSDRRLGKRAGRLEGTGVPSLELNFVGVCAADWNESYRFYTQTLGVRTESREGNWAMLGGGWDDYLAGRSRGMVLELFDGARPPDPNRRWGDDQAIRPGILVTNLVKVVAAAKSRGVQFTGDIEATESGQRIEFEASEGIRWTIWQIAGARAGEDLSRPYVGIAEVKTHNLSGQRSFYRDVLGMRVESDDSRRIVLAHHPDGPRLVLEGGGETHYVELAMTKRPERSQPIFLSVMASDLRNASRLLQSTGANVVKTIEHHDWGGADLFVADADGNTIQVVQYDSPRRYGERLRAQAMPGRFVATNTLSRTPPNKSLQTDEPLGRCAPSVARR